MYIYVCVETLTGIIAMGVIGCMRYNYIYYIYIDRKGGGGFSGCTEYEIVSGGLMHVYTYSIHSLDVLRLILSYF